ncbi:MAG: toll/interleukin-1 receptor domain-containing protein [Ferruginibacter sp.]
MYLKKIFFSYSRTDAADFALRLAVDLKKEGFNIWIDQQDIRAGSEWDLEIERALETCDCLLFIESENSVVSNNVLNEVYYALEQHKKVIPIIFHDSKTPFRLQRLQHIDFTTGYDKGLANLISELKRDPAAVPLQAEDVERSQPAKRYIIKLPILVLMIGLAVIIAGGAVIYSITNKKEAQHTDEVISYTKDTVTTSNILVNEEPDAVPKQEGKIFKETIEKKAKNRPIERREITLPDVKKENLDETFAGNWSLAEVLPKPASKRGFLKIEEIESGRVKIQSSFQFYYFRKRDTTFLVVFNGFAGCNSCVLKDELTFIDKDLAIGSQHYSILQTDTPGEGKAGDTTRDAGLNNTIYAAVTLHLINSNTAIIKVRQSTPTTLSSGLVVKPFVYTFRFEKSE